MNESTIGNSADPNQKSEMTLGVGCVTTQFTIVLPHNTSAHLTREEAEKLYASLGQALGKGREPFQQTPYTGPTHPFMIPPTNPTPWGTPRPLWDSTPGAPARVSNTTLPPVLTPGSGQTIADTVVAPMTSEGWRKLGDDEIIQVGDLLSYNDSWQDPETKYGMLVKPFNVFVGTTVGEYRNPGPIYHTPRGSGFRLETAPETEEPK